MPALREVAPGRLEIREGGGCLTLFGLPFLAVGIYASLATLGLVTMRSDGHPATQAAAAVFAVAFTLVGGVISFGRSITTIDVGQQVVTKQWRILLPVRTWTYQLGDYTIVSLAFVRGDSDSADRYPIALKGNTSAPLQLCSPTQYAEARRCATAVARQLDLDIEDTSTDHGFGAPRRGTTGVNNAAESCLIVSRWPEHRVGLRGLEPVREGQGHHREDPDGSDNIRRGTRRRRDQVPARDCAARARGHCRMRVSEIWRRFAGRGMYPHQLAFLLLLPFRRIQLSPAKLLRYLQVSPPARVLELGSGPGFFSVQSQGVPAVDLTRVASRWSSVDH
jgi:hypothetical protein